MVSVSILLNIGNALLLVVAVAISALVLDWPLRYWQGSKVELVRVSTTGTSAKQEHRLIVYLAGIMAQSQDSSQDVSPLWLKHGNVLFVEYQGKRFRASEVVDKVVAFISDHDEHDEIVVIGSSMGGLLGYDVIRRLDAATQSKVVFLAIDAPTSARDFYLPSNVFAQFMRLPFGPIWNLLSRPLLKLLMVPPKDENIEEGVNREELFRRFRKTWDYPFSFYRDQVKYIITHGRPQANSLRGIKRLIYVASRRDDMVRGEGAFEAWRRAFGRTPTRIRSDTTHVGYAERRKVWLREVFTPVFERLLG